MRSHLPDVEVVDDLWDEEVEEVEVLDFDDLERDLDPAVWQMREELVLASRRWDHGSAAEALALLEVHRAAPAEALISALLVCTHRRYARCSRTLMHRLEDAGVLLEVEVGVLAALLLWQDKARFAIPSTWLSTRLDVPPDVQVRAQGFEVVPPDDDEQTFPYVCNIPAAARRWAVRRLLDEGQTDVDAVLGRARELGPQVGGTVLCGALDAWESCLPDDLARVVQAALRSGRADVRLRALEVLALTGDVEAARGRARRDPAAKVRAWQPPTD